MEDQPGAYLGDQLGHGGLVAQIDPVERHVVAQMRNPAVLAVNGPGHGAVRVANQILSQVAARETGNSCDKGLRQGTLLLYSSPAIIP